jgi:hypothetical protein
MAERAFDLRGIKETVRGLEQFDKDAVKAFNRAINSELKKLHIEAVDLVVKASSHGEGTPLSGWRATAANKPHKGVRGGAGWPAWNAAEVIAGISHTRAEGKVWRDYTTSAGALINDSAAGRIFELAGKKTPGNKLDTQLRKAGYGKPRRLVWKVVWENRERVKRNIYDALEEAKKTLQQHLDSQK